MCIFCFQSKQNSIQPILDAAKRPFFFPILSSHYLIRSLQLIQNIPKDAAWKSLQPTQEDSFYLCNFCFEKCKILYDHFSTLSKNDFFSLIWFVSLLIRCLKESTIHQKTPREQPHNTQSGVHFGCVIFLFKKKKNCVRPISIALKRSFFFAWRSNLFFSYFILLLSNKFYKIYYKMQRQNFYNLRSNAYCHCFQNKQNFVRLIFAVEKIDRTEFRFFWKQKVYN